METVLCSLQRPRLLTVTVVHMNFRQSFHIFRTTVHCCCCHRDELEDDNSLHHHHLFAYRLSSWQFKKRLSLLMLLLQWHDFHSLLRLFKINQIFRVCSYDVHIFDFLAFIRPCILKASLVYMQLVRVGALISTKISKYPPRTQLFCLNSHVSSQLQHPVHISKQIHRRDIYGVAISIFQVSVEREQCSAPQQSTAAPFQQQQQQQPQFLLSTLGVPT